MGGSLKVLNERHGGTDERFGKGANISVTLDVEIPKEITTSPNAPELFGDAVVRLIQQYAPATSSQTVPKVGLIFEAEEIPESVGIAFKKLNMITSSEIVRSMEEMTLSNKNPLDLEVP